MHTGGEPYVKSSDTLKIPVEDLAPDLVNQFYRIFLSAPVSLWIEDFSAVKHRIDELKKKSVTDFRTYFHRHPDKIISLASEVSIVDVNEATVRLYQGSSKKEFLEGLSIIFSKSSYDTFREELITFAEGQTEFSAEAVNLTLKGEERQILLKVVILFGYEDTWSRVLVSVTDITDLKRKQDDLQEDGEFYERIFRFAPEPMLVADPETGFILHANEKASLLLGIPSDELVGMHCTEIHSKEESGHYRRLFERHTAEEEYLSTDVVLCRRDGRHIPVSIQSCHVTAQGKRYIMGIFRKDAAKKTEFVSQEGAAHVSHGMTKAAKITKREYEVLHLIASANTNKKIAQKLCISEKTVETHRSRIMKKLGVHKTADLVRHALTSGLCEGDSKPLS